MKRFLLTLTATLFSCVTPEAFEQGPDDRVTHTTSGLHFPKTLGEFERGETSTYGPRGLGVTATYTRYHLRDRINATLFVYPNPPLANQDQYETQDDRRKARHTSAFERVKKNLVEHNPDAEFSSETHSVTSLQQADRHLSQASYLFSEKVQSLDIVFKTDASLVEVDDWLILARLTAPADSMQRSGKVIGGFYKSIILANGGIIPGQE